MPRVRPGVELVRATLCPRRELMTLDLPTLERPRKAISGGPGAGKWETSVAAAMNWAKTFILPSLRVQDPGCKRGLENRQMKWEPWLGTALAAGWLLKLRKQCAADCFRLAAVGTGARRLAAFGDGLLQGGQKSLTGAAVAHVRLHLFAHGIVELFVQVVGKSGKELAAAVRFFLGCEARLDVA